MTMIPFLSKAMMQKCGKCFMVKHYLYLFICVMPSFVSCHPTYQSILDQADTLEELDLIPKGIPRKVEADVRVGGEQTAFNMRVMNVGDFGDIQELADGWKTTTDLVTFFKKVKFPDAFDIVEDEELHNALSKQLNINMAKKAANQAAAYVMKGNVQN
jgi:hypothetical protein